MRAVLYPLPVITPNLILSNLWLIQESLLLIYVQGSLADYQKLNQIIKKVSLIKVNDVIHLLYAILIIFVQ